MALNRKRSQTTGDRPDPQQGEASGPAAAKLKDLVPVVCPKCGRPQPEPRTAYSTRCKQCGEYFRVQEVLKQGRKADAPSAIQQRTVHCFSCSTELRVSTAATSTMCKRCGSHVDLEDYQISATVSKNFRTYGRLIIQEKGYVLNTEAVVGEAIVKGRLIGKLRANRILEIHSTARIKGSIAGGKLVIPAGNQFTWPDVLELSGAEIAGELSASLEATGTVTLKSSARFFGSVKARDLVVEAGAVLVGAVETSGAGASAP